MPLFAAAAVLLLPASPAAASTEGDRYYYEEIYGPYFAPDPQRPGFVTNVRPRSNPASFAARKPTGSLRVMIAGGSTAAGYKDLGALGWGLSRALTGVQVEEINLGMSGYDEARVGLVLDEALRYDPDIVVLFPGHNDFYLRLAPPPPRWKARALEVLMRWDWFRELRTRRSAAESVERRVSAEYRARRLQGLLTALDENLRKIRSSGARAVVALPPLEYRASAVPGELPPPWHDRGYVEGFLGLARKRPAEAAAAFQRRFDGGGARDGVLAAFLLHGLAQAHDALGRPNEAGRFLERALDAAAGAEFCGPACARAERETAERRGALVVDVDAAFRAYSAPRLPGIESFVDEIHWHGGRNALITRALIAALRSDPRFSGLAWESAADLADPRPIADDARRHRLGALFFAAQKLELTPRLSLRAAGWLEAVGTLEPAWLASAEALESAVGRAFEAYDWSMPGQFRSPLARRAVPRARLAGYLGLLRLREGRFAEAEALLARAAAAERDISDFHLLRAAALAMTGRRHKAREALAAASYAMPREAAAFAAALGLGAVSAPAAPAAF